MRKMLRRVLLPIAFLLTFFAVLPEPAAPQPADWPEIEGNTFVLRGVRVFDGYEMHESRDVLVEDGIVTVVSPKVPAPDGVPELAADGHTLLPAFIDAHTHNWGESRSEALRFGVGTQIDMFSATAALAAAREQRESVRRVNRADLWSAGTLVTATGGHGTQFGLPIPTLDAAAEAAAFIEARIAEGSDFIKLVLEDRRGLSTLDSATLTAAIQAAHANDKLAVVHVSTARNAAAAIQAGADGLVHVFRDAITPELEAAIVESGAFVIPTLAIVESLAGRPNGLADDPRIAPYLSPSQRDGLSRRFPGSGREQALVHAMATTRALFEAGVPILAGTDAPNPGTVHGASLHRELALLVEAGLPPAAALSAATALPAETFGIEDRGRVAAGFRADLVLVKGDPLADVTATRDIVAIWKNGYRVERARFDGAESAPTALAAAPSVLGAFDGGDDGWLPSTDAIMGGKSTVSIEAEGGVLTIEAEVRPGAPYPWAGAVRGIVAGTMEATDATAWTMLEIRVRGKGTAQFLFFSGPSWQAPPIPVPLMLDGTWQAHTIDLADVPGLDLGRLRAVGLTAGPAPGAARLEIDSVVLR